MSDMRHHVAPDETANSSREDMGDVLASIRRMIAQDSPVGAHRPGTVLRLDATTQVPAPTTTPIAVTTPAATAVPTAVPAPFAQAATAREARAAALQWALSEPPPRIMPQPEVPHLREVGLADLSVVEQAAVAEVADDTPAAIAAVAEATAVAIAEFPAAPVTAAGPVADPLSAAPAAAVDDPAPAVTAIPVAVAPAAVATTDPYAAAIATAIAIPPDAATEAEGGFVTPSADPSAPEIGDAGDPARSVATAGAFVEAALPPLSGPEAAAPAMPEAPTPDHMVAAAAVAPTPANPDPIAQPESAMRVHNLHADPAASTAASQAAPLLEAGATTLANGRSEAGSSIFAGIIRDVIRQELSGDGTRTIREMILQEIARAIAMGPIAKGA